MLRTAELRKKPTRQFMGNFVIERHPLKEVLLLAVNELKPENNVWSSNCYLLNSGDYAVVIDPGLTALDKIDELLNALEIKKTDVLLTHGHFDHTYAAARILRHGNIYIHKMDIGYISGLSILPSENEQIAHRIAVVDFPPRLKYDFTSNPEDLRIFNSKTRFLHESESMLELPIPVKYVNDAGHTIGHTIYRFNEILFVGDAVSYQANKCRWAIDFMFGKGEGRYARDKREIKNDCMKSLEHLIAKENGIKYIAPGHTEPDQSKLIPMEEFRQIVKGVV
ncbi:MBL fold metallo-hydrolase [Candidatus Woesearchaeota archaeon]|nr:MBL fold metallo-hydrolase [Candidatus Woesearchaeota archaeon]